MPRLSRRVLLLLAVTLVSVCALGAWAATTYKVSQKNKMFAPDAITIKVGDTLKFVNDDTVTHNVFCVSDSFKFNLKQQAPHATTSVVFPKDGTFELRCAIHPTMKLMVTVKK